MSIIHSSLHQVKYLLIIGRLAKSGRQLPGGMLILGIALGVGGTLLVQKQPWSKITQENTGADYDANKMCASW